MTMAIDFGTCNTVLARWNTATRRVDTLHIDEIGRTYHYRAPGTTEERKSAVIPSLVHYGEGNALSIGAHVENAGLTSHRGTFRWVKLDILRNNSRLEGLYAMATSRAFQVRLLLLRAAAGSCGQLRAAAGSCGQQRRRPTSNQSCVLHLLLPTVAPDPACPCLPRVERRHHCSSA